MQKRQYRFPIGEIPDAYLTVLEYVKDGVQKRGRRDAGRVWRYRVQFHCCLRETVLAHRAIQVRLKTPTPLCRYCGLEKGQNLRRGLTAGEKPWVPVPWPPASTARPRP